MFSSRKKHSPSNSAPANRLASQSQASQQLQFPTKLQSLSQSHSQSPQQKQQSQPVYPWSAHVPPFGSSLRPLSQEAHTLSTTTTTTRELFLFGGYVCDKHKSTSNDLYVISTRDSSVTLLQTSGDAPSPRCAHGALLTSTTLLIWGGTDIQKAPIHSNDDSFYLLDLGTLDLIDVKTRSS